MDSARRRVCEEFNRRPGTGDRQREVSRCSAARRSPRAIRGWPSNGVAAFESVRERSRLLTCFGTAQRLGEPTAGQTPPTVRADRGRPSCRRRPRSTRPGRLDADNQRFWLLLKPTTAAAPSPSCSTHPKLRRGETYCQFDGESETPRDIVRVCAKALADDGPPRAGEGVTGPCSAPADPAVEPFGIQTCDTRAAPPMCAANGEAPRRPIPGACRLVRTPAIGPPADARSARPGDVARRPLTPVEVRPSSTKARSRQAQVRTEPANPPVSTGNAGPKKKITSHHPMRLQAFLARRGSRAPRN